MKPIPSHLFVSSTDGGLYDTRRPQWEKAPVRRTYRWHFTRIDNARQLKATLRAGAYAWPGGYPLFFITSDGGALSFETVRKELRSVLDSVRNKIEDGWRVIACEINYEDAELTDSHTGERIESAYGEESPAKRTEAHNNAEAHE